MQRNARCASNARNQGDELAGQEARVQCTFSPSIQMAWRHHYAGGAVGGGRLAAGWERERNEMDNSPGRKDRREQKANTAVHTQFRCHVLAAVPLPARKHTVMQIMTAGRGVPIFWLGEHYRDPAVLSVVYSRVLCGRENLFSLSTVQIIITCIPHQCTRQGANVTIPPQKTENSSCYILHSHSSHSPVSFAGLGWIERVTSSHTRTEFVSLVLLFGRSFVCLPQDRLSPGLPRMHNIALNALVSTAPAKHSGELGLVGTGEKEGK